MYCCNAKVWIHTNKFTDSITSKKTSFLRYLTPSPLQDTAFVKATGGLGAPTSNLWPSWVIYLVNKVQQDQLKIQYKRNLLQHNYWISLKEHILVMFVVVQTLCWPRRCCLWSRTAMYKQDTWRKYHKTTKHLYRTSKGVSNIRVVLLHWLTV